MRLGVILAGGRGSRFGDPLKCLRPVCGVPMLLRVAAALQPHVDELVVATTKRHGPVAWLAETWGMRVVYTEGAGYEADFEQLAELAPAVIAPCDLPFLEPRHVERLLGGRVMTTALSNGKPVGLTWLPNRDTSSWEVAELGPLINVNSRSDWAEAEGLCGERPTYPLVVDPSTLLPHEDSEEPPEYENIRPIVVEAWTCVVLDGHHRLEFAKRRGIPIPVIPMTYSALDVYMGDGSAASRLEVLSAAARGEPLGLRATRHYYKGLHVSQLNHVALSPQSLVAVKPLRCNPL